MAQSENTWAGSRRLRLIYEGILIEQESLGWESLNFVRVVGIAHRSLNVAIDANRRNITKPCS